LIGESNGGKVVIPKNGAPTGLKPADARVQIALNCPFVWNSNIVNGVA
jgi:hypothetical protein